MSTLPTVDVILQGSSQAEERPVTVLPLEDMAHPLLLQGIAYWRGLCAGRKRPERGDVTLRGLAHLLHYAVLIRVIDGGRDYQYGFEGDAHVQAHGMSIQGKLWSQVRRGDTAHYQMNKRVYDRVVESGEPLGVCGWMVRDARNWELIYREAVYLPLGTKGGPPDNILGFAVYTLHATSDRVFQDSSNPTQAAAL